MDDKNKQLHGEMAGKVVQMGAMEVQMGVAHGNVVEDELPGFKVNYNGGGEDEGEGSMENGSVARGEADSKPVMVENVSVGGLNEKVSKTASGDVAGGSERGENGNSGQMVGVGKSGRAVEAGNFGQMTEAEARAILIEDNARAKEDLKKANSRGKKTLVAVLILAVVLVAAGIGVSVILGGMSKNKAGNGDKQEGNGGENSVVVEKPEEPEVVKLSLDDELVQQLMSNFRRYRGIKGFGWLDFYDAVRKGELSDAMMLNQVMFNSVGTVECVGEASEDDWADACYDGREVLEAAKRIFGKEIEVYDGFSTGKCAETYDAENEIFIGNYRCGGSGPYTLRHDFVSAEREGDKLYLYEAVVIYNEYAESGAEIGYYRLKSDAERDAGEWVELGERLEIDPEIWLTTEVDADAGYYVPEEARPLREYAEQLDLFKWTFVRNAEGNYVFEWLERMQ